jgi:ribosomal protein S18 acetylase RimI-like enzyme
MKQIRHETEYGHITGFVNDEVNPPFGYIENITVDEDKRGHGLGGILLRIFENMCKREGATSVSGWVNPANREGASNFFKKNGYNLEETDFEDIEIDKNI